MKATTTIDPAKAEKLAASFESVAEDVESGKLIPGFALCFHQALVVVPVPCCAVGHACSRAGETRGQGAVYLVGRALVALGPDAFMDTTWLPNTIRTAVHSVLRANDAADKTRRAKDIADACRHLAYTIRKEIP